MNSYPFGVSGLLLAPPPPPPSIPPDTTATENAAKEKAANSVAAPSNVKNSQSHRSGYSDQYQQNSGYPVHLQTMVPAHNVPPNIPPILPLPPGSNPGAMMMVPHGHLGLPPPPPPPPPMATALNEHPKTPNHYGMQYANDGHGPIRPNHQRPQQHGKQHLPFRGGGPSPWAPVKHAPSGLQGPWQAPTTERPSGAFEQLHPPGVSCDQYAGVDQVDETKKRSFSETSSCSGSGSNSESNNVMAPQFSSTATTYKEHRVDPKDPKFPRELTDLFEALNCKLCEVLSSSTVQAKHHYSGKPHEKKVRQWLQKWSEETGQPMPKRQKLENNMANINPEDLYCKLCDVNFTSVKHGEQHKMGKPHQKALRLGYSTAKQKFKKVEIANDIRFGIGEGFRNDVSNNGTEKPKSEEIQESAIVTSPSASKIPPLNCKFYCDLCQISTTSQEHLDAHYVGAKHRKALVNAARAGIKPDISVVPPPVEPAESILASVISDGNLSRLKSISSDLSIYRTPSGQFYCGPCNTTVNSEKSFKEHTESKRHKFKVASSKRP